MIILYIYSYYYIYASLQRGVMECWYSTYARWEFVLKAFKWIQEKMQHSNQPSKRNNLAAFDSTSIKSRLQSSTVKKAVQSNSDGRNSIQSTLTLYCELDSVTWSDHVQTFQVWRILIAQPSARNACDF